MFKIIKNPNIKKKEEKFVIPFLRYLLKDRGLPRIHLEPIRETKERRPDYYVSENNSLIEIKEIHDKKSREQSAQWGNIVNRLKGAIEKNKKLKKIKGLYLLDTPPVFKFPTERVKYKETAELILSAILTGQKEVTTPRATFEIKKVSDKDDGVYFGTSGPGGSFDPAMTIHRNIYNKLETADEQLSLDPPEKKVAKRMLLLVNQYIFTDIHEVIRALSYAYDELLKYKNIDEVWLQMQDKKRKFVHILLYTRNFIEEYEKEKLQDTEINHELFEKWFTSLERISDEHKKKLFKGLQIFFSKQKPHRVFSDVFRNTYVRQEIVRLGLWLIEKKRFKDTLWLIDRFTDDPDPIEPPEDYVGNPDFNYHLQIKKKIEEPIIITTVQGHLAWVVQKLALHKNYIDRAFDYTQKILRTRNNLYTTQQWLIPLIEIANRRFWLKKKNYLDFRKLLLNELLEKYSEYPALAKYLVHIFHYFKDLTTEETKRVLAKLKFAPQAEVLFIYFALFRERHYKDKKFPKKIRDYNSNNAIVQLKKKIEDLSSKNEIIRGSIAWNFWKILHDDSKEFDTIASWVDEFIKYPYTKNAYDDLLRIVEEWIEEKPDICIDWFCQILDKISKFTDSKEKGRDFWLSTKTGKILNVIAQKDPKKLIGIVNQLVKLWKLGSFVGSPKEIFESYEEIPDEELRLKTKKKFQAWYNSIKKLNPKLEMVNWD